MNEPNAPTYQLYEGSRGDWVAWAAAESVKLPELPDFLKYQSRFSRLRLLMRGCKKALSISEVKVDPLTLTNSNKKFFIFDFDGKNRILLFASPDGIKALSESLKWHADGTFYTRTKYFGLSDYLEEIVNMFLFDLPTKKAKLLEDSDEDHIFDSSDPESDRGSDIELNLRKRETYNPSDDDAEIPTIPTIRTQDEVMLELDFLFGDSNDTTASCRRSRCCRGTSIDRNFHAGNSSI